MRIREGISMWRMPYVASLLISAASIAAAVGVLWFLLVGLLQLRTLFYLLLLILFLKVGRQSGIN